MLILHTCGGACSGAVSVVVNREIISNLSIDSMWTCYSLVCVT